MNQNIKKYRINYLITTFSAFVFFFLIYGILGTMINESQISNSFIKFIAFGFLGSCFTGIVSGGLLFIKFIKNESNKFKLICAIFFPITGMIIYVYGIIILIPYGVYNIVEIKKIKQFEKDNPQIMKENNYKKRITFPYKSLIGLFKSSVIAYICVSVLSISLTIYFVSYNVVIVDGTKVVKPAFKFGVVVANGYLNPLIGIAIFLILSILFNRLIINRLVSSKFKKINEILLNDCNASSYIDNYNKFVNVNLRINDKCFIYCSLSTGFIANGDFKMAIEILKKIDIKDKKIMKQYKLALNSNLLAAYLFLNDFENAAKCLMEIKNMKDNLNKNVKILKYYNECLDYANARYNVIVNKDSHQLKYFENRFNQKIYLFDKIMAKYYLGVIYKNLSDDNNEKECCKYVISNGKDLFVASLLKINNIKYY